MTPTPGWLQKKLFERRIVFVTGHLDEALAGQAAAQIITLDACGDAPIDVVLGSADGTLEAAFVLIDALDATHATVRVQCQGQVGGPVIGVVAVGDERSALVHTTFRLALPAAQLTASGRAVEDVADDMRRARYLDAREALAYGLIDGIKS